MQSACLRVHHQRQGIEIGVLELCQLSVLHQQSGNRMSRISEFLQNTSIGGWTGARLLEDRQAESSEENFPKLRVRVDVELGTRCRIDLLLYILPLTAKALLERMKPR